MDNIKLREKHQGARSYSLFLDELEERILEGRAKVIAKQCNTCRVMRFINDYPNDKNRRFKKGLDCNFCNRKRIKKWQEDNPEKYLESSREYQSKHREESNKRAKKWREDNPERAQENYRRNYEKNKEKIVERNRIFKLLNPEQVKKMQTRYRKRNPEKISKARAKRRGFGYTNLNTRFTNGLAHHHLWLEGKDFTVYLHDFLHKFYPHDHEDEESLIPINAVTLDFFINEELYKDLFYPNTIWSGETMATKGTNFKAMETHNEYTRKIIKHKMLNNNIGKENGKPISSRTQVSYNINTKKIGINSFLYYDKYSISLEKTYTRKSNLENVPKDKPERSKNHRDEKSISIPIGKEEKYKISSVTKIYPNPNTDNMIINSFLFYKDKKIYLDKR